MIKFLFKYATRGRPALFISTFNQWNSLASGKHQIHWVITTDQDDDSMKSPMITSLLSQQSDKYTLEWHCGRSNTKVEAINADIDPQLDFDLLIAVSDDMIPQVQGYDDIIGTDMLKHFPKFDGALHYPDGIRKDIITLSILGKKLYERFGYIYHPDYRSEFCDNEQTDVAKQWQKYAFVDRVLIKHCWDGKDQTYQRNAPWRPLDKTTYFLRSQKGFPKESIGGIPQPAKVYRTGNSTKPPLLTLLIPSIYDRADKLQHLLDLLEPQMTPEVERIVLVDQGYQKGGQSIGSKRNELLSLAQPGGWLAFLDDDDEVTPNYIELILQALKEQPVAVGIKMQWYVDGILRSVLTLHDRTTTHLCPIRTDLARKAQFPVDGEQANCGEDMVWAYQVKPHIEEFRKPLIQQPIYIYWDRTK